MAQIIIQKQYLYANIGFEFVSNFAIPPHLSSIAAVDLKLLKAIKIFKNRMATCMTKIYMQLIRS